MSESVVILSEYVARRRQAAAVVPEAAADVARDFCFWQGASGQRYVHHVYSLVGCPQLPRANYLLVGRDDEGRTRVMRVARAKHEAPSLNLADIRHRGAKLGATEVHVHMVATSDAERRLVELDLRAGLLGAADQHPLTA
jgi:hypothetical protein